MLMKFVTVRAAHKTVTPREEQKIIPKFQDVSMTRNKRPQACHSSHLADIHILSRSKFASFIRHKPQFI
jgi:hypothetical protein